MAKFFSKRRLKIAEQIIIVIFFAVIIPMTISAFIINNVNQQSNRAQLRDAAVMIANIVSEEVDVFQHSIDNELTQIATTLEYYDSPEKANEYLSTIIKKLRFYKELSIVSPWQMKQYSKFDYDKNVGVFNKQLKNGNYLVALLSLLLMFAFTT